MKIRKPDRIFFLLTLLMVIFGFAIFSSAALGQVDKNGASFNTVLIKQLAILLAGLVLLMITANLPYQPLKKWSPFIFIGGLVLSCLVFVPGLGFAHNGATRWLDIGPASIQPAEFLKLALVIFLAAWAWATASGSINASRKTGVTWRIRPAPQRCCRKDNRFSRNA